MIITALSTFHVTADLQVSGLTPGIRVIGHGTTPVTRVTAGITEYPAGSGIYQKALVAPSSTGTYWVLWDTGTTAPGCMAIEDLTVT